MAITRFRDIPQRMPWGNYKIDVDWLYLKTWIEDAKDKRIEGYDYDFDPDFQRGHVWTRKQQIDWVEFALSGGMSGRTLLFNHPSYMGNYRGTLVLVDGKQRLTATLAFLDNKIPAFGTLYKDFEDSLRRVDARYEVRINNLQTREELLTWYIQLNSGGTPHTQKEIDKVRELLAQTKKEGTV
jgi:hypothetical protein